ncbi:hypothetical protein GXW71_05220 [Roseomonas hellenica]|uniref:Uncharacterized protein n=1 Tax=Plastoroseomonas hellenica TaxID=2687306 RepID=A0ABS5ETY6_9PROT|nr:hypothetical protein [Plastoroseomonas hellenica]MBR0663754.1 hypothetical protein [Plastoroseomonas hellenica]
MTSQRGGYKIVQDTGPGGGYFIVGIGTDGEEILFPERYATEEEAGAAMAARDLEKSDEVVPGSLPSMI